MNISAGLNDWTRNDRIRIEGTAGAAIILVDVIAIVTGFAFGLYPIAAGGLGAIGIAAIAIDGVAIIAGFIAGQDAVATGAHGAIGIAAVAFDIIAIVTGLAHRKSITALVLNHHGCLGSR